MMNNNNITTAEVVERGYNCLFETLGTIDTERFISFILSERFDYTKWRREYFGNMTVEDISAAAVEYEKANPFTPKKPQISVE
ncbi:hypothetical protein [Ruminococcus sp.]|uniref:hypothetical protein n=1 Tax=Ruminococcus sp. TaxID=41978 RepID=UPI0025CFEDBF|nr:hypothetical protein [Ruminococcus sp.]